MIWKSCRKQLWMSIISNLNNLIIIICFYLAPCCSNWQWNKKAWLAPFQLSNKTSCISCRWPLQIYLGKGGSKEINPAADEPQSKTAAGHKIFFWRLAPVKRRCTKNYCRFQQNKRDMYGHPWWENIVFHHSWHVRIGVSWWGFASIGRLFAPAFFAQPYLFVRLQGQLVAILHQEDVLVLSEWARAKRNS